MGTKRVALYIRVGTKEQAHEAAAEQYERLSEYAREQGYEIVRQYSDIGLPSTTWLRKGLQAMLEDAENGVFDAVLVVNRSRLMREEGMNFPFEVIALSECTPFHREKPGTHSMIEVQEKLIQLICLVAEENDGKFPHMELLSESQQCLVESVLLEYQKKETCSVKSVEGSDSERGNNNGLL